MYDIYNDEYILWCKRSIISDCFKKLQYNSFANMVMDDPASLMMTSQYLAILIRTAKARKNNDVLYCLAANGLLKEGPTMDKKLSSYIDKNIISENAYKSRDGYSLQVCDLDDHEKSHLLDWMFKYDPIATDLLLDRMQDLINERIPFVEARENINRGLRPIHDNQTGEVSWVTNNASNF